MHLGWSFSIQFGFYKKKVIKLNFFKKNQNRTETGSNRPILVRFGFFRQKPVDPVFSGFAWFFRFDSVFSAWLGLTRFFSSLVLVFFSLGSVRFFRFRAYKTETKQVDFFKILIGLINFFSQFNFFSYCFCNFLAFIDFLIFFCSLLQAPLSPRWLIAT